MRPRSEILQEDFNVEDLGSYEADLVEAGQQSVHQDLMDAASALESAFRYIKKGTPVAVRNQMGEALTTIERTLAEIEG
jgi:hypothetical protein